MDDNLDAVVGGENVDDIDDVVDAHPPDLSPPTNAERKIAEQLIDLLTMDKLDGCQGTKLRADKAIGENCIKDANSFTIDMQGKDAKNKDKPNQEFDRYSIQYGKKNSPGGGRRTFATLHVRVDTGAPRFTIEQVKDKFNESLKETKDKWLE